MKSNNAEQVANFKADAERTVMMQNVVVDDEV
jgi:hypothetical protein